jgi:hypothetical protein
MKSIIFWDMTPCSPLSFNRRFGGTCRLHVQGRRKRFRKPASRRVASYWFAEPISSTLKMEAICFSETSVETQRTTRRHIPEDDNLQYKPSLCNSLYAPVTSSRLDPNIFLSTMLPNPSVCVSFADPVADHEPLCSLMQTDQTCHIVDYWIMTLYCSPVVCTAGFESGTFISRRPRPLGGTLSDTVMKLALWL